MQHGGAVVCTVASQPEGAFLKTLIICVNFPTSKDRSNEEEFHQRSIRSINKIFYCFETEFGCLALAEL